MDEPGFRAKKKQSIGRRDFLDRILAAWGALALLPFVYGTIRFLLPVRTSGATAERVIVGQVSDLALNSAKIIRLNDKPVVLIKTPTGQIKALSARCTHLGCTIKFREEGGGYLLCNCHGSRFDLNGKNLAGPAPRPLQPYKVSLEDDKIALIAV